jgi:hypothetical protein
MQTLTQDCWRHQEKLMEGITLVHDTKIFFCYDIPIANRHTLRPLPKFSRPGDLENALP